MEIILSEAQEMLKRSARELLQRECPADLVAAMETDQLGYPPQLWQRMSQAGWLAWPFPEKYGGGGGDFFDLALLAEEMGYAAFPSPFFSSIVLGGLTLLEAGTEQQKRSLLPRVASGEIMISLAHLEVDLDTGDEEEEPTASIVDSGYMLQGSRSLVPNAHTADLLMWTSRTTRDGAISRGNTLFMLDPKSGGVALRQMSTTAGDKQFEVSLKDVSLQASQVVGRAGRAGRPLQRALLKATALKCAEMVGGAQAVLDLTVEYAKKRVQFGRPIGTFQAVQHHCADMYRNLQIGRMLAYQACWNISQGLPAVKEVSSAKLKLSRAYPAMTRMAHQITGAVGYYTEYPLERYTRRALAASVSLGGAEYHAQRLADTLWG